MSILHRIYLPLQYSLRIKLSTSKDIGLCCLRGAMMEAGSKGSWWLGLVKSIDDPTNHIISSNLGIVLKDKYPKAKHHFLVLPKDDIPSIYHLNPSHLELLADLYLLAMNIIEVMDYSKDDFKIGFHAQPSMYRLHLHVISKDFVSPCLKKKKHWNGFNTKLFREYDDIVAELKQNGNVNTFDKEIVKELEKAELQCNQCEHKPNNLPNLKNHLLTHLNK